ncbi:hypothetical protein KAI65_00405 [Candidatus Parcubacteria bacterium]|nr:hypothetical protein [Candidatus Parcubacteria bacterium]
MAILKNKINLLFYSSIIFFIITCSTHIFNKNKTANAIGSSGGRISTIILPRSPDCTPQMCTCNSAYMVTIVPYGGNDSVLCIPVINIPVTGLTISMSSIGYKMLGYWTATQPTAASGNWGTSP